MHLFLLCTRLLMPAFLLVMFCSRLLCSFVCMSKVLTLCNLTQHLLVLRQSEHLD